MRILKDTDFTHDSEAAFTDIAKGKAKIDPALLEAGLQAGFKLVDFLIGLFGKKLLRRRVETLEQCNIAQQLLIKELAKRIEALEG